MELESELKRRARAIVIARAVSFLKVRNSKSQSRRSYAFLTFAIFKIKKQFLYSLFVIFL